MMEYFTPLFNTLHQYGDNTIAHLPNIIIAIIFIFFTYFVVKIINHVVYTSLTRFAMRTNLVLIFQKIIAIIIWFFCILIVVTIVFPSVTTANLLTTLGLTSVAIGFAFKDIFENFLAGILILLREPFHLGDYIITKDKQGGYVEKISIRNTHLRQSDGIRLVIPNATLINSFIQVITDLEIRRTNASCSVGFVEDIDKVRKIIKKTVEKCETVEKDKYIYVFVKEFTSNGVDFDIYWWAKSKPMDMRRSHDEVLSKIKKAFDAENIQLTYSTTLSFQEPLVIKNQQKEK